jgi:dUTP pyrophosphatase
MYTEPYAKEPKRATFGSCGYDIFAPKDVTLKPGEITMIDTGICLEDSDFPIIHAVIYEQGSEPKKILIAPIEWMLLVLPRSSFGTTYGLSFENTASVIDKDYRDSIKLFVKVEKELHMVKGERLAQFMVYPHCIFANEDTPTEKRNGGLGSTGR